jgi:hypothetical protein
LISDTVHEKKLELAGENGIKTVYDLQSYWTSMAAILDSLGFTFLIDRMTEVLTPDIYIELTAPATQPTVESDSYPVPQMRIEKNNGA